MNQNQTVNLDDLFSLIEQQSAARKLPPVESWRPSREASIDIRIDEAGDWWHEGDKIQRQGLINVFSTILRRDGEAYFLVTPAEKLAIQVADVPFLGVDVDVKGQGHEQQIVVQTNVGDLVWLDADHPLTMRSELPYIRVRGGLQARLTRAAFYRLVEFGAEEEGAWVVYSQGARFSLGSI